MVRDNTYLIGNQFAKGRPASSGAFKKGDVAWNKGIKGIHLNPKTEFKIGQMPVTWKPVGTVTIRTDKNGTKRNFIKLSEPKFWEEQAKYLWKQKYGCLLIGDVVHHINGIATDDFIDNLIALPRNIHPTFHTRGKGVKIMTKEQIKIYTKGYLPFQISQQLF